MSLTVLYLIVLNSFRVKENSDSYDKLTFPGLGLTPKYDVLLSVSKELVLCFLPFQHNINSNTISKCMSS